MSPLTADAPPGVGSPSSTNGMPAAEELALVGKQPGTNLPFSPRDRHRQSSVNPLTENLTAVSPAEWNPVFRGRQEGYFYAPRRPAQQLYLRLNGTETVQVSASQARPDPNGTQPARFHFASPDGEVGVLLEPREADQRRDRPGPGSNGGDLYRYEVADERLTDITVDSGDPRGRDPGRDRRLRRRQTDLLRRQG